MPLRMAAKVPRSAARYYKERLAPMIDGEQIRLVGELNDHAKGDLLRGAAALLFHRLARAVRPGDDRGDGLRHARHCAATRIGA
jgi:hypothetical protein